MQEARRYSVSVSYAWKNARSIIGSLVFLEPWYVFYYSRPREGGSPRRRFALKGGSVLIFRFGKLYVLYFWGEVLIYGNWEFRNFKTCKFVNSVCELLTFEMMIF